MKTRFIIFALLTAMAPAATAQVSVENLRFMAGTWTGLMNGVVVTSRYDFGDRFMQGYSETRDESGRAVAHEYVTAAEESGGLVLTAKGTSYKAVHGAANLVAFENANAAFPKRITYYLEGSRLVTRLEGMRDYFPQIIEYRQSRVR